MFTKQLIEEIKKKLFVLGKSDSLFEETEDLDRNDFFAVVKDGENKKISVNDFVDSDGFSSKLQEVLPERLVIYDHCTFYGTGDGITIESDPETGRMRIKNRTLADGGMGYIILESNKSFVNQIGLEDTIYEVRYDFTVTDASIDFPTNSVLYFNGGSLTNNDGTTELVGDNAVFSSIVLKERALINVVLTGDWTEQELEVEDGSITKAKLASDVTDEIDSKQDTLVSAINIKTINNESILGEGDLEVLTEVEDGSITQQKLATGAVTNEKLASSAVGEGNIASNSVSEAKIATDAVTSNKIKNNAVTDSKIASNAVTNSKIAANAVTAAKIQDASIVTTKIDYGAVTKEKLSTDVKNQIDDTYRKSQVYNTNQTYSKSEVFNKTEIGTMFSPGEDTPVVLLDSSESTVADVLDAIDLADRPNKIFRVKGDDGTYFEEYAWNGEDWILLARKDYGIEYDEPKVGSTDLITSDAVAKVAGSYSNINNDIVYAITDSENKMLLSIEKDGTANIPGLPQERGNSGLDMVQMTIDSEGKIVSYRLKDGTLVEDRIQVRDLELGNDAIGAIKDAIGGGGAGEAVTDYNNWDIPQTEGGEMVIKKSESLTNIQWTPIHDVPTRWVYDLSKSQSIRYFAAGNQVTGIPYSQSSNINKIVGYDVSLETFMTAVHNPYSLLYTEILCKKHDGANPDSYTNDTGTIGGKRKSAYGKTNYSGINKYVGAYYGNVCSTFTSYCTGLPDDFRTVDSVTLNKIDRLFGKVFPQTAQGVKTGDVIYEKGHVWMVKEVQRDGNFTVINVLKSEQGNTHWATETLLTAAEFDAKIGVENENVVSTIYRPTRLYNNTTMFDFDADKYVYNDDICTFAGNKACFKEGDKIYIHCFNCLGSGGYTSMELYKDDVLLYTIAIEDTSATSSPSVYPVNKCINTWNPDKQIPDYREIGVTAGTSASHYVVNLTNRNLTYGNYKARLRVGNTSTYSEFTYFQIIDTDVSYSYVPDTPTPTDTVTINYSSKNGIPSVIKIVQYWENAPTEDLPATTGIPRGYYIIQPKDYVVDENGAHGSVTLSADYFLAQNREEAHTMTSGGQYYLKVFFKSDWGRVTNDPQVISFTFNYE